MRHRRIGLLGGSFNPAHAGHLHIAREAIKRLQLQEVWWLVSPQNPLKSAKDMAPYPTRLAHARHVAAQEPRIVVTDLEQRHHLYYTIDTLKFLQRRHRDTQFVWLMGADNLKHFHRWKQWQCIAKRVPIAILDRAPYAFSGLASRFALYLARHRLRGSRARILASKPAPCWGYITLPRHPLSATFLRKTLGSVAYLRHTEASQS